MSGKFITFEGCEGSGKTTQQQLLMAELKSRGKDFVFTREPGGNPVSERIRALILDTKTDMSGECEALLYAASRVQVLKDVIIPSLHSGKTVVCDRYIDSSFAYQGVARGLGEEFIERINSYAIQTCMPDITFFLDIDPVSAFLRKNGADENDRMEQAGIEFHKKVYSGYISAAKKYPDRIVVVDSKRSEAEIHADIMRALEERGII